MVAMTADHEVCTNACFIFFSNECVYICSYYVPESVLILFILCGFNLGLRTICWHTLGIIGIV